VDELIDTAEGGFEDGGVGGLDSDFTFVSERDADGGGEESGSIVDAVADVEHGGLGCDFGDEFDLFLGTLAEVDLFYAGEFGEIADFTFAVTGEEDYSGSTVACAEVFDEVGRVLTGLVSESDLRGEFSVDYYEAFEA
jgi:hypothetical protein